MDPLSDTACLLAAKAPVLRRADEPRRSVCHRAILPGPHHRRIAGRIKIFAAFNRVATIPSEIRIKVTQIFR